MMLQPLACSLPLYGCKGSSCFLRIIDEGEAFLRQYPRTPFRQEQIYHLALANETWWSLSKSERGDPTDPTAEGAKIGKAAAERARKRAIELYEELLRIAPETPQARKGQLSLPRLKLGLDSRERTFFCFSG